MLDRRTEIHYETMEKIEAIKGLIEGSKAMYEAEIITKEVYEKNLNKLMSDLCKLW